MNIVHLLLGTHAKHNRFLSSKKVNFNDACKDDYIGKLPIVDQTSNCGVLKCVILINNLPLHLFDLRSVANFEENVEERFCAIKFQEPVIYIK